MKRRYLLITGIVFLLLFYLFSIQVKKDRFKKLNFDFTVRLQDKIPKRFDGYWEDLTFLVEPTMSLILVSILTIAAVVDIRSKKLHPSALLIPIFFGLMILAEMYGKSTVESPAPPFFMLKNPTTIFPKYHVQEAYSYPSGHASRALYMALTVWMLFARYVQSLQKRILAASILAGIVFVICIGKIYLGHHWFSDIIGGLLLASAMGTALFSLL